jgi:hypothetical protein
VCVDVGASSIWLSVCVCVCVCDARVVALRNGAFSLAVLGLCVCMYKIGMITIPIT